MIIGTGAINLDLIFEIEDFERSGLKEFGLEPGHEIVLSQEKSTYLLDKLKKEGSLLKKSGGGSSANTLCALAALGHPCAFIGCVGKDEDGDFLLAQMNRLDLSGIFRSGSSSKCIIVIDRQSNDRAMAVVPGDFNLDSSSTNLQKIIKQATFFHFSSLTQEYGPVVQKALLDLVDTDVPVSFDPGEVYAKRGIGAIKNLLSRTDLLFITEYEIKMLFANMSKEEILKKYLRAWAIKDDPPAAFFKEFTPPIIAKKMGAKGAELINLNKKLKMNALEVSRIIDNTGAGDAFNAGMIDGILSGKDSVNCLKRAISLAAFSLGFPGRSWIEKIKEQD